MHKYLRAIGFSKLQDKKALKEILTDVVMTSTDRDYTKLNEQENVAIMSKNISPSLGISVCGDLEDDNHFVYDYYFPYLRGYLKSLQDEITVERHSSQISYAGSCEDMGLGAVIIFYLQNFIGYMKAKKQNKLTNPYVSLTALSVNGRILLPLAKNSTEKKNARVLAEKRKSLMQDARKGVESAIESLTMQDVGIFNTLSKKIQESDLYSLVDTSFIPCGVECDNYAVVGEILQFRQETNMYTHEKICILTISCNNIMMDIAINELDLMGEPAVGRRFKGDIWLQGSVHVPAT